MNKLLVGILITVIIAGAGAYYFLSPAFPAAVLHVETGTVEVNTGGGWMPAQNKMELRQAVSIRTIDGVATVVILGGEILHLEPNTEIVLDNLRGAVSLAQKAGETWHKVTRISGISQYRVTTPSTVASVRGTDFFLTNEDIAVVDGNVAYGTFTEPEKVTLARQRSSASSFEAEPLTADDLAKEQRFLKEYILRLVQLRREEILRHTLILMEINRRGYSEDQVFVELEKVDAGEYDLEELYQNVPLFLRSQVERTYLLTKEIREARKRLSHAP